MRVSSRFNPPPPPIRPWLGPVRLVAGIFVLLGCSCAAAADSGSFADEAPAVGPRINAYYQNPDVERWTAVFESSGREVFDRRFRIRRG